MTAPSAQSYILNRSVIDGKSFYYSPSSDIASRLEWGDGDVSRLATPYQLLRLTPPSGLGHPHLILTINKENQR